MFVLVNGKLLRNPSTSVLADELHHLTSAGKVISSVLVTGLPPSIGSQTKLAWKSDMRLPILLCGNGALVVSIRWPGVNSTRCTSLDAGIGKPGELRTELELDRIAVATGPVDRPDLLADF